MGLIDGTVCGKQMQALTGASSSGRQTQHAPSSAAVQSPASTVGRSWRACNVAAKRPSSHSLARGFSSVPSTAADRISAVGSTLSATPTTSRRDRQGSAHTRPLVGQEPLSAGPCSVRVETFWSPTSSRKRRAERAAFYAKRSPSAVGNWRCLFRCREGEHRAQERSDQTTVLVR